MDSCSDGVGDAAEFRFVFGVLAFRGRGRWSGEGHGQPIPDLGRNRLRLDLVQFILVVADTPHDLLFFSKPETVIATRRENKNPSLFVVEKLDHSMTHERDRKDEKMDRRRQQPLGYARVVQ